MKKKRNRAEAQSRYREKLRERIRQDKLNGCIDCGETDIVVLQHHHRNPKEKLFTIGGALGTMAMPKLEAELAKCDVVCANCHLRRHAHEKVG